MLLGCTGTELDATTVSDLAESPYQFLSPLFLVTSRSPDFIVDQKIVLAIKRPWNYETPVRHASCLFALVIILYSVSYFDSCFAMKIYRLSYFITGTSQRAQTVLREVVAPCYQGLMTRCHNSTQNNVSS